MQINFLNIKIDNLTMAETISKIDYFILNKSNIYIVTPNLDHIVKLEKDKEFAEVYAHAGLVVADGKPLIWISRLLRTPIKEKISGSDLFPQMCKLAAEKGYKVFILGAADGVAVMAARNLQRKYNGLQIAGTYSPSIGFEKNKNELRYIKKLLIKNKPDILAVALGSPKGEKFIYNILKECTIPVSISVGATIDFEAGNIKRAPKWMSDAGLEWLYRITQDPKRLILRYLNDIIKIIPIYYKYKK